MIQLTRASEYALRGMQYLARQPEDAVCMLAEISQAQDVPVSFLGKIFQALARANIVRSHRGAGGGFSLARAPESITMLQVVEAVEGKIALYECITDPGRCPEERRSACNVRPILYEAIRSLEAVFGQYTIADVVNGKDRHGVHQAVPIPETSVS